MPFKKTLLQEMKMNSGIERAQHAASAVVQRQSALEVISQYIIFTDKLQESAHSGLQLKCNTNFKPQTFLFHKVKCLLKHQTAYIISI